MGELGRRVAQTLKFCGVSGIDPQNEDGRSYILNKSYILDIRPESTNCCFFYNVLHPDRTVLAQAESPPFSGLPLQQPRQKSFIQKATKEKKVRRVFYAALAN